MPIGKAPWLHIYSRKDTVYYHSTSYVSAIWKIQLHEFSKSTWVIIVNSFCISKRFQYWTENNNVINYNIFAKESYPSVYKSFSHNPEQFQLLLPAFLFNKSLKTSNQLAILPTL